MYICKLQLQEVNITMVIALLPKELGHKLYAWLSQEGKKKTFLTVVLQNNNNKLQEELYGKINKSKRYLPLPSFRMIYKLSSDAPAQLLISHDSL
jgi:hypothetical protein